MRSKNLVIYGASGHAKVIADIIEKSGDTLLAFVDDDRALWTEQLLGYGIWKGMDELIEQSKKGSFSVIVGIGINHTRRKLSEQLKKAGIIFGTAIHPSVVIGRDVIIGEGTVIMANAVINPCTSIGNHCIINTGVTVDHDNVIGDFVHLSPGAHLGGTVQIGAMSWVGLGAKVINNINIGENVIVGAGSTVIRNIEANSVVVGTPAALIKENPNVFLGD